MSIGLLHGLHGFITALWTKRVLVTRHKTYVHRTAIWTYYCTVNQTCACRRTQNIKAVCFYSPYQFGELGVLKRSSIIPILSSVAVFSWIPIFNFVLYMQRETSLTSNFWVYLQQLQIIHSDFVNVCRSKYLWIVVFYCRKAIQEMNIIHWNEMVARRWRRWIQPEKDSCLFTCVKTWNINKSYKKTCKAVKKYFGRDLEFTGSFVRKVTKYAPNLGCRKWYWRKVQQDWTM